LLAHVPGAIKNSDDHYLHYVRVELRQLRIVLNMAKELCADDELDSLRDLVRELGTVLGRSRDWDIFVNKILPAIYSDENSVSFFGHQALTREGEKSRQLSHQLVNTTLQSIDFQRLLLRFGAWLNGDYWKGFTYSGSLHDFSEKTLRAYTHKVLERGNRINANESDKHLHKLRIACKNLRYSAELLIAPLGFSSRENQIKLLVKLQDILGALNDNAVALHLLDELNQGATIDHISLIKINIISSQSIHLKVFRKIWKHFIKQTGSNS
jgi:CHAD domain-containing protein